MSAHTPADGATSPRRARRMAEATGLPMFDRRAASVDSGDLLAGGVHIPRAGNAVVVIDDHAVPLTHLDRILWPAADFTKADLVAYYLAIAPAVLPHLVDRALTLGRFPGGVDGRGFAQTEVPGRPDWIRSVPLRLANGAVKRFTIAEDRASLAWLAQMGTIELHTFLATVADLDRPAVVLFDLDPAAPDGLLDAAAVALRLRGRITELGLVPFVKTSGSAGMHVLVPLAGAVTYEDTRRCAARIAAAVAAEVPDLVSTFGRTPGD
jgi:bifunctional non-homologous end joining protein LigD